MKAIQKKVGFPAMVIDGDISYEFMSDAVGGDIEMVPIGPDIDVVCNEEGMWAGPDGQPLPQNAAGYLGDILIVALDKEGEVRSMKDEEVRKGLAYLERLKDVKHPGDEVTVTSGNTADLLLKAQAANILDFWKAL